jgi:hypothetical protein
MKAANIFFGTLRQFKSHKRRVLAVGIGAGIKKSVS